MNVGEDIHEQDEKLAEEPAEEEEIDTTAEEMEKVVYSMRNGKSSGAEELPGESSNIVGSVEPKD